MALTIEQIKVKAAELAVAEVFSDSGSLTDLELFKRIQEAEDRLDYDFPGGAQVAEFHEEYCVYDIKRITKDLYDLILKSMFIAAGHERVSS